MLTLYRRHRTGRKPNGQPRCPHAPEWKDTDKPTGRAWINCKCPIWCDGELNGQEIRQSMKTRDWARAVRRLAELENQFQEGRARKKVQEAVDSFIGQCSVEPSTPRKYKRLTRLFVGHMEQAGATYVDKITLDLLDGYRTSPNVCALTWSKELQLLRQFFGFCMARKWVEESPAKAMKMPPEPKPGERVPYTSEEITRILVACETFGRGPYERLRAKAAILLLRFYGLRVSDVATLAKSRVRGDQIFLHALKNGAMIWLPLYPEVKYALDCLPLPMGAAADCPYFFWTGAGSREGHIKTLDRSLQAVFTKSGVKNAHSHRFRHTLASSILASGGTVEDAANILGDSPDVIRRY
jgi:site-specific recombinase XerD